MFRLFISSLVSICVLTGFYFMLRLTVPYFSFATNIDFLLTKQSILHKDIWRWSFYIHISTCLVVIISGLLQFSKFILTQTPSMHRALGKIYVLCVLTLSAPSGLIMGIYANGGFWSKTSFVLISIGWWFFTFKAFRLIRKQQIEKHIQFMIRSYALTLTALTLRLYVLVFPHFFILPAKDMYTLVAWLSWIPNLIVAEIFIHYKVFSWKS